MHPLILTQPEQLGNSALGQNKNGAVGMNGKRFGIVRLVRITQTNAIAGVHVGREILAFLDDREFDGFSSPQVIADVADENTICGWSAWTDPEIFRILRRETVDIDDPKIFAGEIGDEKSAAIARVVDVVDPIGKFARDGKPAVLIDRFIDVADLGAVGPLTFEGRTVLEQQHEDERNERHELSS